MKKIDTQLFNNLADDANKSKRGRAHHTLHPELTDPTQRMCVAINPGSYIQPHRHATPAKWELFLIFKGAASILLFDEKATVTERIDLDSNGPVHACEIPPNSWHTLVCLKPGTILMEIKPGPYEPLIPQDFAAWAPNEGDETAPKFEKLFRNAHAGDCFDNKTL